MVRTEDACEIIKYALQNEIKVYLDGGWGVDAVSYTHLDVYKRQVLMHFLKENQEYTMILICLLN